MAAMISFSEVEAFAEELRRDASDGAVMEKVVRVVADRRGSSDGYFEYVDVVAAYLNRPGLVVELVAPCGRQVLEAARGGNPDPEVAQRVQRTIKRVKDQAASLGLEMRGGRLLAGRAGG